MAWHSLCSSFPAWLSALLFTRGAALGPPGLTLFYIALALLLSSLGVFHTRPTEAPLSHRNSPLELFQRVFSSLIPRLSPSPPHCEIAHEYRWDRSPQSWRPFFSLSALQRRVGCSPLFIPGLKIPLSLASITLIPRVTGQDIFGGHKLRPPLKELTCEIRASRPAVPCLHPVSTTG